MYYLVILLLFFLPLNAFADSSEKCSILTDISNDVILNEIKNGIIDFSYCELIGIKLNSLDLTNANFFGSNLSGSYFYGSNLENADFNNAILYGTNFQSTNLENADFNNAILDGSTFRDANLENADFVDSSLKKRGIIQS